MDFPLRFPAVNGMGIGGRIKDARKRRGISQAALGKEVGRSQSAVAEWETGETEPRRNIMDKIAAALHVEYEWLVLGGAADQKRDYAHQPETDGAAAGEDPHGKDGLGPVYASELGAADTLTVDRGEIVEYREKPSRWLNVVGLYAFYAVGDGMEPRIKPGEVVWIHPHRRPSPGQEAAFLRREGGDKGAEAASVRVLVYAGHTGTDWIVRQFNPEKEFNLKKSEWDCQLIVALDFNL